MTKPRPDGRAAYADITVPCHEVSFAHDLVAPPVYGRELVDSIPGVTFDVVDDAGHFGSLGAVGHRQQDHFKALRDRGHPHREDLGP